MVCVPRVLRLSVLYSLKRKKEFLVFRLKAIGQRGIEGKNPGKMQKGVDFNGRRRAQISFRLIFPRKRNWHASYFFKEKGVGFDTAFFTVTRVLIHIRGRHATLGTVCG